MRKVLAIAVSVILFSSFITIARSEDFSADMLYKTKSYSAEGKMFVTSDKTRMETPQGITIVRMDRNVMWVLLPDQNMYMEQPIEINNLAAMKDKIPGEIERTLVGKESVDGKIADKYKIVYSHQGLTSTVFQWIVPGTTIPVKTMSEDGNWMVEYKNISRAKQSDSLFELPAGYKKFSYDLSSPEKMLEMMGTEKLSGGN